MTARMPLVPNPLPSAATVGAAALLLATFFGGIYLATPTPRSTALGLALIVAGIAIRFIANATLRKNEETSREGLYALCRHPMYAGTILVASGIAVAFNHPAGLGIFAAAVAISLYRIRKEELYLISRLPDYARYKRDVPAFPTPGSVRRALASGRLRQPLSLRQCFLNGEMLRLNLYLPLLLAAGFYLQVPWPVLAGGGLFSLAFALVSMRLHPSEGRRARSDYFLPALLDLAVLGLVLVARI